MITIFVQTNNTEARFLIDLSILVLLLSNLKSLASLQRSLGLHLALLAFKTENQSLCLLRLHVTKTLRKHLLVENGLCLTSITLLLHIVSTLSYQSTPVGTSTLRSQRSLSGLVLGNLMLRVLIALLAVGVLSLWNVDLQTVSFHSQTRRAPIRFNTISKKSMCFKNEENRLLVEQSVQSSMIVNVSKKQVKSLKQQE